MLSLVCLYIMNNFLESSFRSDCEEERTCGDVGFICNVPNRVPPSNDLGQILNVGTPLKLLKIKHNAFIPQNRCRR
jgi:hypothetical protein